MMHRPRGRPPHPGPLTPAEQRVLRELRRGGTNAEIAERLGLSSETVKTHVARMLAKLELRTRRELAAWEPQGAGRWGRVRALVASPAAHVSLGQSTAGVSVAAGIVGAAVVAAGIVAAWPFLTKAPQPVAAPVGEVTVVASPAPGPSHTPTPAAPTPATPTPTAPTPPAPAPGAHPCEQGIAVPGPAAQPELVADCKILLAVKETLEGTVELNWSGDRFIDFWDGIGVVQGRVAYMNLVRLGLTGSIPPELAGLTALNQLVLWENRLTGPIPPELGALARLWALDVDDNRLTGPIPPELGRLTNLQSLGLSGNDLTGSIPPELGALSQLRVLDLAGNRLSGAVPSEVAALPSLELVTLEGNPLTRCLWPPGAAGPDPPDGLDLPDCTRPPDSQPVPIPPLPQGAHPEILYLGEVSPERRAEIRSLTLDAMSFFAARFGGLATDFTLYVVNDEAARSEKMTEVLGVDPGLQCGLAEGSVAFVQEWCAVSAIPHEYFHVLQHMWAPDGAATPSDTGWPRGAWWLTEGSAEYAEMRLGEAVGADAGLYGGWVRMRERASSREPASLRDLESYVPSSATTPYDVAAVAVDWLVERTGEDALIEYYRVLPESADWRSAFLSVFGMTVDDFYAGFAEHRTAITRPERDVRGVVLKPDGDPVNGWRYTVWASPRDPGGQPFHYAVSFDGSFRLRLEDGSYDLQVTARCGEKYVALGWYAGESGLLDREYAEPVVVSGPDVAPVEIELQALPPEFDPRCDFGPRRAVRGAVSGPDGEPLCGIDVYAWDRDHSGAFGRDSDVTQEDGTFVLHLPDGVFRVSLVAWTNQRLRIPAWADEYDVKPDSFVTVDGADIAGIEISVPVSPDDENLGPDFVLDAFAGGVVAPDEPGEGTSRSCG